jgi:two-component SAPR family response regulator
MFGINGAKRATKDNGLITFKDASEIHQRTLEWIGKNSSTNDEVMEKYNTLKNEISIAAKKSVNLFMDSPIV